MLDLIEPPDDYLKPKFIIDRSKPNFCIIENIRVDCKSMGNFRIESPNNDPAYATAFVIGTSGITLYFKGLVIYFRYGCIVSTRTVGYDKPINRDLSFLLDDIQRSVLKTIL